MMLINLIINQLTTNFFNSNIRYSITIHGVSNLIIKIILNVDRLFFYPDHGLKFIFMLHIGVSWPILFSCITNRLVQFCRLVAYWLNTRNNEWTNLFAFYFLERITALILKWNTIPIIVLTALERAKNIRFFDWSLTTIQDVFCISNLYLHSPNHQN